MMQAPRECIGAAAAGAVRVDDFFNEGRQLIFSALLESVDDEVPMTPPMLANYLAATGQLEKVGGHAEIADIWTFTASAADFAWYVGKLREKAILRALIQSANDTLKAAYDEPADVAALLDEREAATMAVRDSHVNETDRTTTLIQLTIDYTAQMKNGGQPSGMPTGFADLDKMTGGWRGGEMSVIAARPSMGKTAFALALIERAAMDGVPVAFFSLEMSSDSIARRMIASIAGVELARVNGNGLLSRQRDVSKIEAAAEKIVKTKVFVNDAPALSVQQLRAIARRLKQRHGIGMIAIDYLQLMVSNSRQARENRQLEVSQISQGLKSLSKELNIPVIVLAQLNRGVEKRGDKRPMLSDLRESGAIEQDADLVGLLHRPEYYEPGNAELAGKATLIIAKQRNGATGDVHLTWRAPIVRFESAAQT